MNGRKVDEEYTEDDISNFTLIWIGVYQPAKDIVLFSQT